jgi:hypothetical protein
VPGLLFAKGNGTAKQPEFDWIATDGGTRVLYLRAFDKTENHEPLDHRISGIDRLDDALLSTLQRYESHYLQSLPLLTIWPQMITILICNDNT